MCFFVGFLFCGVDFSFISRFAIILLRKRELVILLQLCFAVSVLCRELVIVSFPVHTQLRFVLTLSVYRYPGIKLVIVYGHQNCAFTMVMVSCVLELEPTTAPSRSKISTNMLT